MAVSLDLADIQGNILTAYGKLGFPKGRCMVLHVQKADAGRRLVTELLPMLTTALRWATSQGDVPVGKKKIPRPAVTVNIAFSFYGLLALELPTRTLRGMPDEFIDGMRARANILGDNFGKGVSGWDEVWKDPADREVGAGGRAHVLITLNAQMNGDGSPDAALDAKTSEIESLVARIGDLNFLPGHNSARRPSQKYQELSALTAKRQDGVVVPLPTEHFGFRDAIGDPVFDGQYPDRHERSLQNGSGAVDGQGNWRPLATGEFVLGYPDEAQEIAGAAMPLGLSRNGTFVAYRKLHQNVDSFRSFMTKQAAQFAAVFGIADPHDAVETLKAKIAGRWSDGVPLSLAPTAEEWRNFNHRFPDVDPQSDRAGWKARESAITAFTFGDDPAGVKCPVTSHMRRVNTRDGLAPTPGAGSALNNRRRILRRGLPYGQSPEGVSDEEDHGIVMLVTCASLVRQFEFVQQQWINYGLDAGGGNDTCPLVGDHTIGGPTGAKAKFVIPTDAKSGHAPFILEGLPQFVETRGGEYFFVPSMTALRMIGMGVVDPT